MDTEQYIWDLMKESRELTYRKYGREINFYYTSSHFPAVSVTGSKCALNCKHCGRKMIERLPPATTPQELVETCLNFHRDGAKGVLITGGCTSEGIVPLNEHLDAIKEIKDNTDLILIAHTGLMGYSEARNLKQAGVECVCIDVVGCEETASEIYGIDLRPEDYRRTLKAFEKAGMREISPHVCVGLHHGELRHELKALEIISAITPTNIVIIGLTNLKGTPMENVRINAEDLIRVLCHARIKFPDSYISLGCARGKGDVRAEIDRMAVKAGVNNIAVPTPDAYREAERRSLEIKEYLACCALMPGNLG